MRFFNTSVERRGVLAAVCAMFLVGCADPLEVDLDVITPGSAGSAVGAQALRAAALRDMWVFTGFNVYGWAAAGLLSDELINARNGFEDVDRRTINNNAAPNTTVWSGFSGVMYSGPRAIKGLRQFVPDSPTRAAQIGEVQSIRGLALTIGGEIFCNGIPFSYINDDGTQAYDSVSYTNERLWRNAITYYDSALAAIPAGNSLRSLARIGKARALLNLNKPDSAAAVVRAGGDGAGSLAVPSSYAYSAEYSVASGLTNGPFDWIPNSANFGTPNGSETANTMNWIDPRIAVTFLRSGQDGVTPVYYPNYTPWTKSVAASYPLATGTEARLIEAEADMRNGAASWLTTLNALRSSSALAAQLPALVDPVTPAARANMLMRERAMWMYLTIHRLGDMRRLVRQYGREIESVFPTGAYFKGGTYGTSVALEPSLTEAQTHPYWDACTDKNP